MNDLTLQLIEKFGAPVLSGALGFAGAGVRFYVRIRTLERRVKEYKKANEKAEAVIDGLTASSADLARRIETIERLELSKWLEATRQALRLEMESHKDDMEQMLKDLRGSVRNVEDSSHDFAKEAALAQFMAQQQDRWERVQRTLGHIEGYLGRAEKDHR